MGSAVIVHAGAWDIPAGQREAHREGARRAAKAGWDVLKGGGSALEAAAACVIVMENDPALNAGMGSVLNESGEVSLDAAVMEGSRLEVGAVADITGIANPVRLAREVLDSEDVFLTGEGALRFAVERGLTFCDPVSLVVPREVERLQAWRESEEHRVLLPTDTVGAVALDAEGRIATATSTGGRPGKRRGRIGDAPVPGAGFYADERIGGAVCSGWGEDILRFGLARRTVDLARDHGAQDASWLAVRELQDRLEGRGGVVTLTRTGGIGWAFDTPAMAVAWVDGDVEHVQTAGV